MLAFGLIDGMPAGCFGVGFAALSLVGDPAVGTPLLWLVEAQWLDQQSPGVCTPAQPSSSKELVCCLIAERRRRKYGPQSRLRGADAKLRAGRADTMAAMDSFLITVDCGVPSRAA